MLALILDLGTGLWWKHHPSVYGGYEGCTGEKYFYPCAQDAQGIMDEGGELYDMYPINWDGEKCVDTGYSIENRTFWVLWGDPLDKYELNKRTGLNPVVSFPFNRGPYPAYQQGVDLDVALDDSADARAAAKDLLVYIEAFTDAELKDWDVTMTEGAESGMTHMWAGKALEIARSTCNRDIFALMETPAYGYSPSDSADIANRFASSFYNSTECTCFANDSCRDPTVTVANVGFVPGSTLPSRMGGDGLMYIASSTSQASPWFESMVFPENPTGKMKTSQIGVPNRLVCDGVYLWPMYFGMEVSLFMSGAKRFTWISPLTKIIFFLFRATVSPSRSVLTAALGVSPSPRLTVPVSAPVSLCTAKILSLTTTPWSTLSPPPTP